MERPLDLSTLFRRLNFPPERDHQVLAVYLFGSRSYGTETPESDWDFAVVVDDEFPIDPAYLEEFRTLHGERKRGQYKLGDVNATVFPASLWEEIIEQHLIWVLFCVFLPAEFKWLEKVDFASHFLLRLRNLRRSVIWEIRRAWNKCRNMFREGDIAKGRKLVMYTLMYIDWGKQVALQGRITDFTYARRIWPEIRDCPAIEFEPYRVKYEATVEAALNEFWLIAPHKEQPPFTVPPGRSSTIAYILAFGLTALPRDFSVLLRRHPRVPALLVLVLDAEFSPVSYPLVRDANGLVLAESEDWRPVGMCHSKIVMWDEVMRPPLQWAGATVTEKLDSWTVCLYFYANEWRLSSPARADATDTLTPRTPADGKPAVLADVFWRLWHASGLRFPEPGVCLVWEVTAPQYTSLLLPRLARHAEGLWLSGAYRMPQQTEVTLSEAAARYGYRPVPSLTLTSREEALRHMESLSPLAFEGIVVREASGRRILLRAPQYHALHTLWTLSKKLELSNANKHHIAAMLQLVRYDVPVEQVPYLSAYLLGMYRTVRAEWDKLCAELQSAFDATRQMNNAQLKAHLSATQRAPALYTKLFFHMRTDGMTSIREEFRRHVISQPLAWLLPRLGATTEPAAEKEEQP